MKVHCGRRLPFLCLGPRCAAINGMNSKPGVLLCAWHWPRHSGNKRERDYNNWGILPLIIKITRLRHWSNYRKVMLLVLARVINEPFIKEPRLDVRTREKGSFQWQISMSKDLETMTSHDAARGMRRMKSYDVKSYYSKINLTGIQWSVKEKKRGMRRMGPNCRRPRKQMNYILSTKIY